MSEAQSSTVALAIGRNAVRNDILNCRQCDRRSIDEIPVPFRGPAPARLMIVGDFPTELEEERGRAFTGGASSWLKLAMSRVGLDMDLAFVTPAIGCHSEDSVTPLQVRSCTRHMGKMVNLCDPEVVMIMGANAMSVVGVKGSITSFHGHVVVPPFGPFKSRNVFLTFHPGAGMRKGAEKTQALIESDLRQLSEYFRGYPAPRLQVGKGGKLVRSTY